MVLQKVLSGQKDICDIRRMYFRGEYNVKEDGSIILKRGQKILSNTYFNSFSLDKWKKYTMLNNLQLELKSEGSIKIRLKHMFFEKNKRVTRIIKEFIIKEGDYGLRKFDFGPISRINGICYFEIKCLSKEARLSCMSYVSQAENGTLNPAALSLVICTFKREDYVIRNLEIIRKNITENPESDLYNDFRVIVVDNGKSLSLPPMRNISIIKNKNGGGAAGFTRGMIETLRVIEEGKDGSAQKISHIILMDDDVEFDFHIFHRVYCFIRMLKKEYERASIGASLIDICKKNIQSEMGAKWDKTTIRIHKKGFDLLSKTVLLKNEEEVKVDYSGWWFACIPIKNIRKDNLPVPVFFHGDDIEYGLRNPKPVILMNGIGVWHPANKEMNSYTAYYNYRNFTIITALYLRNGLMLEQKKLIEASILYLLCFRYRDIQLVCDAAEDFLKGIDWLKAADPEELHLKVKEKGYSYQENIPDIRNMVRLEGHSTDAATVFLMAANYLIPSLKKRIYADNGVLSRKFFGRREIMVCSEKAGKGYLLKKDYYQAYKALIRVVKTMVILGKNYKRVSREYKERCYEIENIAFWKEYLNC